MKRDCVVGHLDGSKRPAVYVVPGVGVACADCAKSLKAQGFEGIVPLAQQAELPHAR